MCVAFTKKQPHSLGCFCFLSFQATGKVVSLLWPSVGSLKPWPNKLTFFNNILKSACQARCPVWLCSQNIASQADLSMRIHEARFLKKFENYFLLAKISENFLSSNCLWSDQSVSLNYLIIELVLGKQIWNNWQKSVLIWPGLGCSTILYILL